MLGQESGIGGWRFSSSGTTTATDPTDLLGRDEAHWSFFFDSDASVMEGNDIEDLGGGSFQTVAAVERYSLLDQYAMGLVPPSARCRRSSTWRTRPTCRRIAMRTDAPRVGVRFNGTRRDVFIEDIIAIHGPRNPSSAQSSRVHRQAFLFVVGAGRTPGNAQVEKVDRIRREWESFFLRATNNRMSADTRLR